MYDPEEELLRYISRTVSIDTDAPERDDFVAYYEAVTGWKCPWFWREIVLPKLLDDSNQIVLICIPPGHSKTMSLSLYAAWRLGKNANLRIIYASHTLDYSAKVLDQIVTWLQHPVSERCFGKLVPDLTSGRPAAGRWTQYEKYLVRPDYRLKDPSLLAVGVGSNVLGVRADLIIGDDIVTQPNSMTKTMRDHVHDWFHGTLVKRLDPKGRLAVIGARFYAEDLYAELMEHLPDEAKVNLTSTPEKPLWPEQFSSEQLAEEERRDFISFQAQYRGAPIDYGRAELKKDWLVCCAEPPEELYYYIGVDPKAVGKDIARKSYQAGTLDEMVAIVGGVDEFGNVYLVDAESCQGKLEEQVDLIYRLYTRWKPVLVGIESNAAQQLLIDRLLDKYHIPVEAMQSTLPAEIRFVRQMASYFRNGKVYLKGTAVAGATMKPIPALQPFVEQWVTYPGKHDDWLSACDVLLRVALGIQVGAATATIRATETIEEVRHQVTARDRMPYDAKLIFH